MSKVRTLKPAIKSAPFRTTPLPPKQADPVYHTPAYLAWRAAVMRRAGHRCEAVERGLRCSRAEPEYRMFADHVKEIKDGGALFDPNNGQCLCYRHHTLKTNAERAKRIMR